MAVNLKEKLERWKTNLLDMSKRNPLLNFRFRKGANLKIVEPSFLELWDSFVQKEQKLTFPLVNEKAEADVAETAGEEVTAKKPAARTKAKQGVPVTDDMPSERQRALRNLKKKAQLYQEEQGINVLYMASGFSAGMKRTVPRLSLMHRFCWCRSISVGKTSAHRSCWACMKMKLFSIQPSDSCLRIPMASRFLNLTMRWDWAPISNRSGHLWITALSGA